LEKFLRYDLDFSYNISKDEWDLSVGRWLSNNGICLLFVCDVLYSFILFLISFRFFSGSAQFSALDTNSDGYVSSTEYLKSNFGTAGKK
jgi:hypothetical protein